MIATGSSQCGHSPGTTKTCAHVWSLIEIRHERSRRPWAADCDFGKAIVIRMDVSIVIAPSREGGSGSTYNKGLRDDLSAVVAGTGLARQLA
ncbi:MAG: hypothetical protein ACRDRG_12725 [Pseudonocardiaceae bacterium]